MAPCIWLQGGMIEYLTFYATLYFSKHFYTHYLISTFNSQGTLTMKMRGVANNGSLKHHGHAGTTGAGLTLLANKVKLFTSICSIQWEIWLSPNYAGPLLPPPLPCKCKYQSWVVNVALVWNAPSLLLIKCLGSQITAIKGKLSLAGHSGNTRRWELQGQRINGHS